MDRLIIQPDPTVQIPTPVLQLLKPGATLLHRITIALREQVLPVVLEAAEVQAVGDFNVTSFNY